MRRLIWRTLELAGFLTCELAFKTNCAIPCNYRLGCWLYEQEFQYGKKYGFLRVNPKWDEKDQPMYVEI